MSTAHLTAGLTSAPKKVGLYDPAYERDACGIGFIADLKRRATRETVVDGLTMLSRMEHRGACGCEIDTGDGAGAIFNIPHDFLRRVVNEDCGIALPALGEYAAGMVFMPKDDELRERCRAAFEGTLAASGMKLLCWRKVPTRNDEIGHTAKMAEPAIEQCFVVTEQPPEAGADHTIVLEKKCYLLRKRSHTAIYAELTKDGREWSSGDWFWCSLSSRTIVYKGMLRSLQVMHYFPDLECDDFTSSLCMVHSRFSTNTFPSWDRAQPCRQIAHNGEINTLKGNVNYALSRQGIMACEGLGISKEEVKDILPIIEEGLSDSGSLNSMLELLVACGRPMPECIMMMVPEAWQNADTMDQAKRDLYEYNSTMSEPWDGPAHIAFTDGKWVGATLDRNGLRPGRFYETHDNKVIAASETGVVDVPAENIKRKGRLQPGQIFVLNFDEERIVEDEEVKRVAAAEHPYGTWLKEQTFGLADVSRGIAPASAESYESLVPHLRAFGWTQESIDVLLLKEIRDGAEALGSMGNDAALACMSNRPRLIYEFFKQLFAQVTNPPLDSVREAVVMSLECFIGPEGDITAAKPESCHRLRLKSPILRLSELEDIIALDYRGWKTQVIDTCFDRSEGAAGVKTACERICAEADQAIADGYKIVVLSDRACSYDKVPLPSLLAVGSVHQHLVKSFTRLNCGLIVDGGDCREVHHLCLMGGFGADAFCPRMVMQLVDQMVDDDRIKPKEDGTRRTSEELIGYYLKSQHKSMLKIFAKIGISTFHSYKGAQIFEAVGLAQDVMDMAFCGTASRVGGLTLELFGETLCEMHALGFPPRDVTTGTADVILPNPGDYHYRSNYGSEKHMNDPPAVAKLQEATSQNNKRAYQDYSRQMVELNKQCTLRGLLKFKDEDTSKAVPLEEVEPAAEIVKRISTGAMSYGSISYEAHSTLAKAMNMMGGKSNTGEGGEAADRLREAIGEDGEPMQHPARSAIKQIASGRFGVTSLYLTNADELQIKMAQGAKPGEGGELPGHKVNGPIATCRNATEGVGLISPPPHHDIYSIEDLKQLISDLKNANPSARVSVKLVSEVGVGVVASGVTKGLADHILISGHDGGTGAARWSSIKHCGLPWELGLAETHQTLVLNDLRRKVIVQTDGALKTGRDLAIATLLGAEEYCMATTPLIVMGCIMMRKCHLNTCPVGIATQDPVLRKKFAGQAEHVVNFCFMLAEEMREIMASLGFRTVDEMVGHCECLEPDPAVLASSKKLAGLDLSQLLVPAHTLRSDVPQICVMKQDHELDQIIDLRWIAQVDQSGCLKEPHPKFVITDTICNTDRTAATMMSHHITKTLGADKELPDDTVTLNLDGWGGQSLGAWMVKGVTLILTGDANDYVGKGLCGGKIIIKPPENLSCVPEESIIIGNVCCYGATSGEIYLRGIAAERFCVRNSGATAVVEGVGDHGCEYMTGGRVVVLGGVGKNFACGMSGGRAYIYDPHGTFHNFVNEELASMEKINGEGYAADADEVRMIIENHFNYTGSTVAEKILADWGNEQKKFVRMMPRAFKAVMAKKQMEALHKSLPKANSEYQEKTPKAARSTTPPKSAGTPASSDCGGSDDKDIEDMGDDAKAKMDPRVGAAKDAGSVELELSEPPRPTMVRDPVKHRGFVVYERATVGYRPAPVRMNDWVEIGAPHSHELLKTQTARCMDCGVPFCHQTSTGCPLGNKIPEWNDLVHRGQWRQALDALLSTNNFPEFTGRVCPAPCEGSCVLGIIEQPVAIKSVECAIIDKGFEEGWMHPRPPSFRSGKRISIVGAGPAGMAAADQLNRAGHTVTVYERSCRPGGLMMYGVPNMKCDKEDIVMRRVKMMEQEGVTFKCNVNVGVDITADKLKAECDALLLTAGATIARDLPIEGRKLKGVHFAMEFLHQNTKSLLDAAPNAGPQKEKVGENDITFPDLFGKSFLEGGVDALSDSDSRKTTAPIRDAEDGVYINVKGKKVIVIGGGDTGNDCLGTSARMGAVQIANFELMPQMPPQRGEDNPWPQWPRIARTDYGHQECKEIIGEDPRVYCILSKEFLDDGNGNVCGVKTVKVEWTPGEGGRWHMAEVPGTEKTYEADYVFLAMGFLGPQQDIGDQLNLEKDPRSNFKAEYGKFATSEEGVWAAGDCRRGQSLVVWAIAEGRGAAREIDRALMGDTQLP